MLKSRTSKLGSILDSTFKFWHQIVERNLVCRYGNMSWHALVEPTAAMARKGFAAHPYLVDKITVEMARSALYRA